MKIVRVEKPVLRQLRHVRRQPRLVARRRVAVQNPFINRFINRRNGRRQQFHALCFVAGGQSRTKFFDLRSQIAAVATVDGATFFVLTNAFFG